jgi:hypothetical protein
MTAPASGRDDATVRGAVVLIVAIVIGLALLARSGGGGGDDEDAGSNETTTESTASTSTAPGDSTTVPIQGSSTTAAPTGSTQDPATVTVAVLNATPVGGWAGENAGILASAGYMTADGNFGGEDQDVTTIYAAPEAQADAQAVAALLDLADAPVTQKPTEPLGDEGQDADAQVVVVLGADSTAGGGGGETEGGTDEETSTTVG